MGLRWYAGAVIAACALLWGMSSTGEERPVLLTGSGRIAGLEASVALRPDDPGATLALVQGYLDARQPGLAIALFDGALRAVRGDVRVQHAYARALIEAGRNDQALEAEDRVLDACHPLEEGRAAAPGCDRSLFASAVRRSGILRELVALGVQDAAAHPEAARIAYRNATREARVAILP
ncbi:MAG: hypothetical protein JOZ69_24055 [Myxococcales bacterium]|nr:hypothetical protein [Myxococcales bacterium]